MQNQFFPSETAAEIASPVTLSVMPEAVETIETTLTTQAVTDMLAQTEQMVRRRKRRLSAVLATVGGSGVLVWALTMLASTTWLSHLGANFYLLLTFLMFVGGAFMIWTLFLPVKLDTEVLMKGGTKAIPILLDAFGLNSTSRHRRSILRALTDLLPRMQASEASLLTVTHRQILNRCLASGLTPTWAVDTGPDFVLAILKAYEQVGDAKAVAIVERLANSRPRNERQQAIQQAADGCLPLLRASAGIVDTTQTLLRASMPEMNTPDTLLRPATATTNMPSDELLRAANSQDMPPSD